MTSLLTIFIYSSSWLKSVQWVILRCWVGSNTKNTNMYLNAFSVRVLLNNMVTMAIKKGLWAYSAHSEANIPHGIRRVSHVEFRFKFHFGIHFEFQVEFRVVSWYSSPVFSCELIFYLSFKLLLYIQIKFEVVYWSYQLVFKFVIQIGLEIGSWFWPWWGFINNVSN